MPPAEQPPWVSARLATVGDRIREARLHANLSQEDLAEKAGCDRRTVSLIENGRTDPKMSLVLKLARALRLSVTDLFT